MFCFSDSSHLHRPASLRPIRRTKSSASTLMRWQTPMNRHLSELLMNVVTAVLLPTEREPCSSSQSRRSRPGGDGQLSRVPLDGGEAEGWASDVKRCKTGVFSRLLLTRWPDWRHNFAPNITRWSSEVTRVLQFVLHHIFLPPETFQLFFKKPQFPCFSYERVLRNPTAY